MSALTAASPLEAALAYASLGWPVIPLHTPIDEETCDCRKPCEDIGKHPRTLHGVKDSSVDPAQIRKWWRMWPTANVGVDLAGAGLLDIAPDSPKWEAEFIARGLPETLTFASGGGPGHLHFLYALPEGVPQARVCKSGEYDILSAGYAVMPSSLHRKGLAYLWIKDEVSMAQAPNWACAMLEKRPKARKKSSNDGEVTKDEAFNKLLESVDMRAWNGELDLDRSRSLFFISCELAKAGANEATIVYWLRERDDTLGWHKYSDRVDGLPLYEDLAQRGLEEAAKEPMRVGQATQAKAAATASSAPAAVEEELIVDAGPPPSLGKDAYIGLLGEFVEDVAPYTEASKVGLALHLLVYVGILVGGDTYASVMFDRHPARLNGLLVGRTGMFGRKGTSQGPAEMLVTRADPTFAGRLRKGLVSGEGLVWAVRDPTAKDPGEADKRLVSTEAEFASLIEVVGRKGNSLSGMLRDAFDGKALETMAKNKPARVANPHIAVIGHVTPDDFRQHVTTTDIANGLINRFILAAVEPSQVLPAGPILPENLVNALVKRLEAVLTWTQGTTRQLNRDKAAGEAWDALYRDWREHPPQGLLAAACGRMDVLALRLQVAYAILGRSSSISEAHVKASRAWMDFHQGTARWLLGVATGNRLADVLLPWLRTTTGRKVSRDEVRIYIGGRQLAGEIESARDALIRAGLIRVTVTRTGLPGRPPEHWEWIGK